MSEDAAYYRRKLDVASERDLDSLNSIHPGVGQAESLDSAPCDRMASPNSSALGLGGRHTDQVPMEELTTRQAQRRHQMSQWGIEFQPTFSDGQWARRSESAEERVQASGSGQGVTGPPEVTDHPDMTAQGDSPACRTPRYTSHHTNYQDMLDSMSPTDPFQGEYIPSGKKKLVSLNTPPSRVKHSASKDKKGLGTRSCTQISADDGDNENPVLRRSQSNVETGERKSKRKKKKQTKNVLLNSTDVSTGTYTLEEPGSYYNVAHESDNIAKPLSGARHRKRKKPKHHTESPGEKGDNVDGESVKSNGTYTVPRSDSQTGLLNLSSISRLSNLWRKKKRQSKRELARMNTGLSAVKSGHSQKALANFITANFMQSECNHYVNSTDGTCKCGRPLQWHQDKGLPISMDNTKDFWHPQTHTEKIPCDSFGEICFQGFGNESKDSPYLRLDPTSDLDKVWTLLTDYWLLPYPTLLISVTGGAQKLHLKPRMEALFQHGLIHAATSTGAWIITGGTNAGVMKCVGEAVKDYLLTADTSEQAKLVSLGIATWGIVANKDALDGEGDRGLFPAVYNVESVRVRGRLAPLDHNHTHFLLLDNGTEMKYGQEIQFRSEFEDYISKRVETGVAEGQSVNVPVVLLVLEGGQGTLRTVWESVSRRTPVVVIQSSGRAADIIAHTFKITRHPSNEDVSLFPSTFDMIALNMTKKDFVWGNRNEASIDREAAECVKQLREILQQRHLINVFNIDDADTKDIDKCILFALLKANKTNPQSQLALALAWNRSDLARQKIFTRENHVFWQKLDLYDAMFTALVQDRVEFVQLFIDHGVDLKRLNVLTLWNLYANAVQEPPNNCAQQFTHWISDFNQSWGDYLCCRPTDHGQFGEDLLSRVGRVFQQLLGEQASNIYGGEKFRTSTSSGLPSLKWEGRKTADCADGVVMSRPRHKHHKHRTGKKKMVQDFQFPERELFIWAVLLNRRRLANMFWKIGRDHIGGALMGATLLKAMSKAADDDEEMELAADLMDHSNHFEALAVAVLSECYNKDKRMAHMLLVRELDSWGKTTLFSLADAGTLMDFMEHTSCQTKLNIIWKGCMAQYTSSLKIILALFLPVFVPAIKFTNNTSPVEDLDGDDDVPEEEPQEEVITPVTQVTQPNTPTHDKRLPSANKISPGDSNLEEVEFARSKSRRTQKTRKKFFHVAMPGGDDGERNAINIVSAIYFFYTAPVTKFYCNLVSYLTFLGIFSFFVLTDLRPVTMANSPSLLEYITWGWSATLAIEEIRQIFTRDPRSLKYKLSSWFSSEWNRLDLTMYFFLIVSIILRLTLWGSNFYWARVTYTITITLFFIRTMQYFYVNKNMGPKVIMIKKMLTDLMFFFFILVVFVVSFGVAYTVNRFPNSQLSWDVLKHVVYLPYWQMYGELFLEDVEGDMPEGSCSYNASVYLGDEDMDRCPEKTWLVPILAALYMLLTNILLVNLLIAMFSYTFERVQENSEKVWRFYRYSLIYEYYDRPTFVPPLIIITHIFRAVKYFIQLKSGSNHKADAFRRILAPDESQRYTALEKAAMEKYATKALLFERGKMDYKVQSTADRLDQVMAELESIKEQVLQDSVEKEAIEPLHTPPLQAQPVSDPGRVRDDMGKLNRRLNHVTDQLTMQSERLDSVLTLLVSMSQRPVGQSNVSPTGSTGVVLPAPQPSQLDSVHIHHLPGSTDEI